MRLNQSLFDLNFRYVHPRMSVRCIVIGNNVNILALPAKQDVAKKYFAHAAFNTASYLMRNGHDVPYMKFHTFKISTLGFL